MPSLETFELIKALEERLIDPEVRRSPQSRS